MPFPRSSGILLHPTSFPSRFGIGDLGDEAYGFINFLVASKQQLWQILPLGPTGYGNSPYMCYSAMAGNPLLISPDRLTAEGWLSEEDLADLPEFPLDRVDFAQVEPLKMSLLRKACQNFKANASAAQQQAFQEFCDSKAYWLDDYALFMSFKNAFDGASWNTWEPELVQRDRAALEKWRLRLTGEIFFRKFMQFEFFRQWHALKQYANDRGIQIIGDIPIYVAHDSADVWAHPEIFCLDQKTGEPASMAGVPPDYFSATGQLWGNPVYLWNRMEKTGFEWWIERFRSLLAYVDIIRIDHFRGFESFWSVRKGETTAMKGKWIPAKGQALLETVREKLGKLPIIAEDLGLITPEVEALRDMFDLPGMKILQFAFGSGPDNSYLPFNFSNRNCVVYPGTHDNDTTVGWFGQLSENDRQGVLAYLGEVKSWGIHWDLIQLAMSSVANQAIVALQDVLGLDTEARMNTPSQAQDNWQWRYQSDSLTEEVTNRLKMMTETYGRATR